MKLVVTNQVDGNKLGVNVQGFTEDSRVKMAEASAIFTSVDNTRALVTMGGLGQHKEMRMSCY